MLFKPDRAYVKRPPSLTDSTRLFASCALSGESQARWRASAMPTAVTAINFGAHCPRLVR